MSLWRLKSKRVRQTVVCSETNQEPITTTEITGVSYSIPPGAADETARKYLKVSPAVEHL